jgi:hypothetical protein
MNVPLVLLNRRRRGGATAFSPSTLFALAEPGVWFDPSDLTTLFQDPAGTTPVTAPGNTVGLMLDKSQSGVGTNGASRRNLLAWSEAFEAGVWLLFGGGSRTGTNIAVAPDGTTTADGIRVTTAGTGSNVYQQPTYTVAAVPYTFSCWVKRNAASNQTFQLFNNFQGAQSSSGNLIATDTWQRFSHTSTSNAGTAQMLVGIIGNTSGTQADLLVWGAQLELGSTASTYQKIVADWSSTIPGNHATQSTLASRPIYGIEPVGGRRNLLTWTEDFGNAIWAKTGVTVPATQYTAPDGTLTADALAPTGTGFNVQLNFPVNVIGTYTSSVSVKDNGAGSCMVAMGTNAVGYLINVNLSTGAFISGRSYGGGSLVGYTIVSQGNGWWRVAVSATANSGSTMVSSADGTSPTTGILIWGAQLELGSTATPYQKVTTQYDVTEAGVASLSYLYFDGVNDAMATSTITPGIDKAQVFTGVRKLSDAADALIAEFSTSIVNNGTFYLAAQTAGRFGFASTGSITQSASASGYTAPITAVLTGQANISGGTLTLRANGTQVAQSIVGQGTGNYLAYPLYLGSRAGTANFFTGHLYSLITRFGPTLNAATITSTEIWVGEKTGIDVAKNISTTIYTRSGDTILDRANSTIERRAV